MQLIWHACDVVAHIEVHHPKLANSMWGERRGCFQQSKQGITPEVSSMNILDLFHINNKLDQVHETPEQQPAKCGSLCYL
jgi:hypothetical protein